MPKKKKKKKIVCEDYTLHLTSKTLFSNSFVCHYSKWATTVQGL